MSDRFHLWRRFLALPNDSHTKTIGVAVLVALISAALISTTSVLLKPRQLANIAAERQARLDGMVAALPGMGELLAEAGVDRLDIRLVDLATGQFVRSSDPAGFDPIAAADDPTQSTAIAPEDDLAGLKRRANLAPVYLLRKGDALMLLILPVYGAGYQSTIRAYLALKSDLNTVAALTVYEQGETPGFGARIQDPAWEALWPGKELADESGMIKITLVRGEAVGPYEVDGISGATRTSNGVTAMMHFWLGDNGYGPLLARLKSEGVQ